MIDVLLVDDEPAVLEVTEIFLKRTKNFNISTKCSPLEAILELKSKKYDVIVSDYEMPEMNGISLLKNIRESGSDIPFIIFTGKGREDVVIEALNCGVDSYIQKGGDPNSQFAELTHKILSSYNKKKAERELIDANEYNKCLIEAHVDPLITIGCDGLIDDVNTSMEEIAALSGSELVKTPFCEHFTDPGAADRAVRDALDEGRTGDHLLYLKTGDGRIVPVIFFATLYHNEKHGLSGIFAELHHAEEENIPSACSNSDRSLELYLDLMGHDIKNAVLSGMGSAEILRGLSEPTGELKRRLQNLDACFGAINTTISNIECLKKIEDGGLVLQSVPLDDVIENELSSFGGADISYKKTGCCVYADSLLGSVFYNLFGNAVSYGNSKPEISVNITEKKGFIEIAIEDDSCGMPPGIMEKISSGELAERKPSGGRCLGLYIVASLIKRYGGSIYAHERVKGKPGLGTSVVFTLCSAGSDEG